MAPPPEIGTERQPLQVQRFDGLQDYTTIHQRMQQFVAQRTADARDEIWLLQHHPVFTQGINGQPQHLLNPGDIAVVQSDRGGQVTYHGPGQLVCYLLLDLRRRQLGVKHLVHTLEQAVINLLLEMGLDGQRRAGAPGIYLHHAKIAALGLRVRRGCSYHGLSLNVNMDLEPFGRINPCGYESLAVTQLADELTTPTPTIQQVGEHLVEQLTGLLAR
ncbi:MAG: lipoyl(octanoyl) transferase LipB [Gammaproteobacteria bacterium]